MNMIYSDRKWYLNTSERIAEITNWCDVHGYTMTITYNNGYWKLNIDAMSGPAYSENFDDLINNFFID